MTFDFVTKPLNMLSEIQTGPFGSQLHKEDYVSVGTPIVTVEHLGRRRFTEQNLPLVSEEDKQRLSKYVLKEGDIVFSRVGSVDRCSYVSSDYSGWMFSGRCLRVRPNSDINPLFLYYFFTLESTKQFVRGIATGATMPSINTKFMGEIPISYPSVSIQKRIAGILSSIDDKIEVNERINQNLQEQAFALFDRLISQTDGEISTLNQIAELNPKRQLSKGAIAKCIDMSQLSTSGAFPAGWEMKVYNGGMRFANGDTILARITPCLENGKTAYIDFLDDSEVAFGSTEYIVISTKGNYPSEFFYCLARYPSFVEYAVKNMNGSSGRQRVSAEIIGKYEIPVLDQAEIKTFKETAPALFRAMRINSLENQRLCELRDSLLPRLMSGELDVSEIEI